MSLNRFLWAPALLAAAAMASGPSLAAPKYRADDVIRAFDPPAVVQGGSRGVCVGTESECQLKTAKAPAAAAPKFDLLISFDYNSDELTRSARQNLDEFAKALKSPGLVQRHFALEGHTDATGTPEYNQQLSERRAEAVRRYLTAKGVTAQNLEARGFGETRPRAPDPLDPSNRRVEARLAE